MWEVQACRACLARDVRIKPSEEHRLHRIYEAVTGLPLVDSGMPQSLCYECVAILGKYGEFRKKCRRADALLRAIYNTNDQITEEDLSRVDRDASRLRSPLAVHWLESVSLDPFHDEWMEPVAVKGEDEPAQHFDDVVVKKEEETIVAAFSPLPDGRDYVDSDGSLKDEPLINYKRECTREAKEKTKERKSKSSKKAKRKTHKKKEPDPKTRKKKEPDPEQRKKKELELEPELEPELLPELEPELGPELEPELEEKPLKLGGRKHQIYPKSFYEEFATITVLTREQQLEEIAKRQESANYKNSPLKCTLCYKGFIEETAFKNHMLRHDPSSGQFECDICRRRFRLLRVLNKHIASNHTRRYTCKWCQHVCTNPCQARMHEKWHKGTCYQCPHCNDSFLKFTSYMGHLRKKHPSQFVCEVCGNAFVSQKGVQLHKNLAHKLDEVTTDHGLGPYCAECAVYFASEDAYKRHLVTSAKHNFTNDCLQGCEECGQTFESRVELRSHLRAQHGRAPRAPRASPRRVVRPSPQDASWPRKCEQCPTEVNSGREYWQHFRRAHKDQNYPKQPGSYTCEICGRGFKVRALLVYHQRKHTGEKPYKCNICSKMFALNTYLIKHERIHTGELPHCCTVCGKGFQTRGNLNKHTLIHNGRRAHTCEHCGKQFRAACDMRSHAEHVHFNKPWPKRVRRRNMCPTKESTF